MSKRITQGFSPVDRPAASGGFSLVELLVVITIIVVLLALLAPALDQAIYQAELTVCGAQVHGITAACLSYAMEFKRHYPYRSNAGIWYSSNVLKASNIYNAPRDANLATILGAYVTVQYFVDPFLKEARLDLDKCMNDPYSYFLSGYHYYADWGPAWARRMKKVGGKFIFNAPEGDSREFGILWADRDARKSGTWANTSHPDKDNRMSLWSFQDGGNPWLTGAFVGVGGATEGNWYVAWWEARPSRGMVDNHYGIDDGSVLRLNDVPTVEVPSDDDPRITFVPDVGDIKEYNDGRKGQLPRQN